MVQFGTSERDSFGSVWDFRTQSTNHLVQNWSSEHRARFVWFNSGLQSAERDSFGSVRVFRARFNLVQFGTSERDLIWFSSGLQSAERDSFDSVRDFRVQSAIHLIQFGTSECRPRFIWFSSGLQSTIHLVQFGTAERDSFGSVRDFRARFIWFSSGLQIAINLVQFGTSEHRA